MKKILFLLFVVLSFSFSNLHAETYYLKVNGDDDLNGLSELNAWATFSKANSSVARGDTVIVMDGTWNITKSIRMTAKGTASQKITYKSQNRHGAKIIHPVNSGNDAAISIGIYDGSNGGWQEFQEMHTVLDGLDIAGGRRHGIQSAGGGYLTIKNCKIHDTGNDALKFNSGADYILFESCEVYNTGVVDDCGGDPPEGCNSEGIDATSSDYLIIRDSYFHDILSWGIVPKKGSQHVIIERNVIINCGEGGISLGESTSCYDCIAKNNIIVDTDLTAMQFSGAKNSKFLNNTCYNVSSPGGTNWSPMRVCNAQHTSGSKIYITFNSGGVSEIVVGDIIIGAASGSRGTVQAIELTSGSWASGNAAGIITLKEGWDDSVYEPFESGVENLNVASGQNNNATTVNNASRDDKYCDDVVFQNNIVVMKNSDHTGFRGTSTPFQDGGGGIEELTLDYNLYWYAESTGAQDIVFIFNGEHKETGISAWRTYTAGIGKAQSTHSIIADPLFLSTTFGDPDFLKINESSPAFGKGVLTYGTEWESNTDDHNGVLRTSENNCIGSFVYPTCSKIEEMSGFKKAD